MPFFLGTWLDPKVLVVVLVLPEWVAPNPPTKPALKPKFDWVLVLVLPEWVAPNPPTKLALKLEFDWVVGCKPAELPEFCRLPSTPRGANVTFRFIPLTVRPMVAMGIPPRNAVIALMFAAAATVAMVAMGIQRGDKVMVLAFTVTAVAVAASTLRRGGVEVSNIVALLGECWV